MTGITSDIYKQVTCKCNTCIWQIYHNLYLVWLARDSHCLSFIPYSFPFHSIFQFQLVYQSCPVAPLLPQPVAQNRLPVSECELLVLVFSILQTLQGLFVEVLPIYVKYTLWQTPSLSNTSCPPVVSSCFKTSIHVQFANLFVFFAPVDRCFL
jgi:hypothetical protein